MGRRDHDDFGYETHQPDNAPDFDEYEGGCQDAHDAFCEGVESIEGVITVHDPQTTGELDQLPAGYGAVLSDEIDYNPASSEAQRRYMGAALGRARSGHPRASDPHMTQDQLADFARKRR